MISHWLISAEAPSSIQIHQFGIHGGQNDSWVDFIQAL